MLHTIFLAGPAFPAASLADPAGSSVIAAALWWLQATLLGTVATTVAIVAVASVGLMMLGGRIDVRHGLTVIAGSFILFGASSIVAGIQASLGGAEIAADSYSLPPPPPAPLPAPPPAGGDPYAGASLPAP